MQDWTFGIFLAFASMLIVLLTYRMCMTISVIEKTLQRWAEQNSLRILTKEARIFFQGPFIPNRYSVVYLVTVEDRDLKQKKGWLRLGWWYIVGFREKIEVRWE